MAYKINPFSVTLDYYETTINTVVTISADYSLPTSKSYFSTVIVTAAAEVDLPVATPGMITRLYSLGANTITVYPASGGSIIVPGLTLGTDVGIKSPGASGDCIELFAKDSTTWIEINKSGAWAKYNKYWTPKDITGCVLWLRSDLGIILNGSTVSTWADQSGNGLDVSQSTDTRQPSWVSNQPNGYPALTIGNGQPVQSGLYRSSVPDTALFPNPGELCWIGVIKEAIAGGGYTLGWGSGTDQVCILASLGGTIYFDAPYAAGAGRSSVADPTGWNNAWHIVVCY